MFKFDVQCNRRTRLADLLGNHAVMYKATSVENIVVLTQCTDPNTFRVKIYCDKCHTSCKRRKILS